MTRGIDRYYIDIISLKLWLKSTLVFAQTKLTIFYSFIWALGNGFTILVRQVYQLLTKFISIVIVNKTVTLLAVLWERRYMGSTHFDEGHFRGFTQQDFFNAGVRGAGFVSVAYAVVVDYTLSSFFTRVGVARGRNKLHPFVRRWLYGKKNYQHV